MLILVLAIFMGAAFVLIAHSIGIGFVTWKLPEAVGNVTSKQVGYIYALNWSVGGILLFPMAWFLICHSLGRFSDIRRAAVRAQMLVTTGFEPLTEDNESLG